MEYNCINKVSSATSSSTDSSILDVPLFALTKDQDCHSIISGQPIPSFVHSGQAMITPSDKPKVEQLTPIYLQHANYITIPQLASSSPSTVHSSTLSVRRNPPLKQRKPKPIQPYPGSDLSLASEKKRTKSIRDILTNDEKRTNHIISEQKRRNTIRTGFKELTEMIPTLKNINNSKSTILFKAVDYIKYLDKRNRSLHDKLNALQVRIQMENKKEASIKRSVASRPAPPLLSQNEFGHLPPDTINALLAHKQQQRQLEELQVQLRAQQRLLAKHNLFSHLLESSQSNHHASIYHSISIPTPTPTATAATKSATTNSMINIHQ